ncbi:protein tweety homolog 1 isoform X2 [Canis lupus baileyi]|uniref:Protein tweety homolog n=2 Tax=Canis lupus familiaris TaxID=9615 RepID=A0A8I3RQJ2_CANLF|nr:protein tweety homolog 1 isoform X2 [Canis lupus dingo]XP_048961520.1 protein tweety homolog 1 isoform X2 [Canis lupus dingo]
MGAPPGYRPSAWVHLLHQLPRADFQLRPVPSGFAPQEQEYQQALLLVVALAGLGLGLSLIFIAVYLIRFCCCRTPEPSGAKSPPPGGGCVTWSCIAALLVGCAGIGIGFYGNSETSDGVSQLSSALLHANHTLSAIDHLVLETVERLGEAVRTELTTLEEVLAQRTELVAAARGARRQAEAVAQQLQGLAFWRGVPLSLLQVAEDVSFVEEYRWLAYVLLLLLELLVCLFTLLGLAKQSKWLVIVMTVMSLLVLVLSWGSMGLEAATAVGLSDFCSSPDTYILNLTQEETGLGSDILNYYFLCNQAVSNPFQQRLTLSQRALANIHSQLQGLEREAVPQFPSAQKPLLSLEETLNVTEGNFHQLVALVHCRGLHKAWKIKCRGLGLPAGPGPLPLWPPWPGSHPVSTHSHPKPHCAQACLPCKRRTRASSPFSSVPPKGSNRTARFSKQQKPLYRRIMALPCGACVRMPWKACSSCCSTPSCLRGP